MNISGKLINRVALVTGASRGIGRAVALEFARQGAHVALLARNEQLLQSLAQEIAALGRDALVFPADLAVSGSLDSLPAALEKRWGKLDILASNAAVLGPRKPVAAITKQDWSDIINVNIHCNVELIRLLHTLLMKSDAGRAIFVTAEASTKYDIGLPGYTLGKAALEALVKCYAADTRESPVRVNLLSPGGTRTDMRREVFPHEDPKTLPTPAEVAALFTDLAAPACTAHAQTFKFREWRQLKP